MQVDGALQGGNTRPRHRRLGVLFAMGVLVALIALVLSACAGGGGGGGGSAQEEAKANEADQARPLPQDPGPLRAGEYHSVHFKPSLSFHVGKGWLNTEPQLPDFIEVGQPGEGGWILFATVKEVYKPGTLKVVETPKDLVGWFQDHPYLKTSKPEPVTVGGVKGKQFEAVVEDLPKNFHGECGAECVDISSQSSGEQSTYFLEANRERRVIVLEDVKGETVEITFSSPPEKFDEFAPEAQKVLESVKWGGS
jgi:hypothetical protein